MQAVPDACTDRDQAELAESLPLTEKMLEFNRQRLIIKMPLQKKETGNEKSNASFGSYVNIFASWEKSLDSNEISPMVYANDQHLRHVEG